MLSILLLVQVAGPPSQPFVTPRFAVNATSDLEYARAPVRSPAASDKPCCSTSMSRMVTARPRFVLVSLPCTAVD